MLLSYFVVYYFSLQPIVYWELVCVYLHDRAQRFGLMIIIFKNPWSRLIDRKQILWSGYWLLSDKYPQSLNMHRSEDLLMARVPKEWGEFPLKLLILLGFHSWEETLRATCTHTHSVWSAVRYHWCSSSHRCGSIHSNFHRTAEFAHKNTH